MMWLLWAAAGLIQQAVASEESLSRRHLNPQEFMTINEIIHYWGYPGEEHNILTTDGYFLKANRIPSGIHCPKTGPKPVVLLVHGLLAEGRCWIANLPSNSLGFFLADAGYDVWIINTRGSTWSRRHQNLSIDEQEFWEFSFHEIAIYDIPATIKFILHKTKQERLYYIGHSQGGTLGFVTFSLLPEVAQKISLYLSFAPGYTLVKSKGLFYTLLAIPDGLRRLIWGNKEYCLLSNRLKAIIAKACSYPVIDRLCLQGLFIGVGFNEKNTNVSRADVYIGIFPDFSSVKAVNHWSQITISHKFRYYDYGSKNKFIYNMTTPPFYRIEDMTVPTAVWSGGNDIMEDEKDIQLLLPRISCLAFYKNIPDWQHLDFIFGLDAPKRLYPDVLNLMKKYK
ncbi:lysosomal acid lipase/cholesteryl ester hydrolase-like [Elgaria multicarinata webbii]|uniref:lysosomal acid lipase/cholesteryl ester hydrolase-like n=1 Tax=Elgaria multicarinata webbii TaxID=159646 RepID=UPI002FCCFD43